MTRTVSAGVDIEVTKLTGNCGAVISGVDARTELRDDAIVVLRKALLDHKVIFLRNQNLDYNQLAGLGKRFGTLTLGHPIYGGPKDKPLLREMDSKGEGTRANHWHADFTYLTSPPAFALLNNKICPPVGGDTIWANTAAAYDSLPDNLRDLADSLRVVHSNDSDFTDATYSGESRSNYLDSIFE